MKFAVILAASTLSAASAAAQVIPGDTVRLRAAGVEVARGTFLRADSGHVYLVPLSGGDTLRVLRGAFDRAERDRRTRSGGKPRGAVIGAVLGAAVGAVTPGPKLLTLIVMTGAAAGGATAGAALHQRGEHWEAVHLPSGRVTDAVSRMDPRRPFAPGDTVRIFGDASELAHGIFRTSDSALLHVDSFDGATSTAYPRSSIRRAEVRRGSRRRGSEAVGQGALIGLAVGGSLGVVIGASDSGNHDSVAPLAGVLVGLLGMLGGSLVGAVASEGETARWMALDLDTLAPVAP